MRQINPISAGGGCMHKCTYRTNTITRIRKRKRSPQSKGEGERSIYAKRDGQVGEKKQPVVVKDQRHEELSTTEKT